MRYFLYMKKGAGFILICPRNQTILLGLRNDSVPVWANFGGMVESCESGFQAAKRELLEEARFVEGHHYKPISNRPINIATYANFSYLCYIGICDEEYVPELNYEHIEYKWVDLDELPANLHFGTNALLNDEKVLAKIQQHFSS